MSIAIASLLVLIVVAIVAIPVLISVFRSAAQRNENRPDSSEEDREHESGEQDSSE